MKKQWKKILLWVIPSITFLSTLYVLQNKIHNALNSYQTSSFRNILEIIYFISSPVLLIITIIGLQQLRISRYSIKLNAKREAYKLAAEQCTYYYENIIPKLNKIDEMKKDKGISSFGETKIEKKSGGYEITNKLNHDVSAKIAEIAYEVTDALNSLESFAVFFTSMVAEESIAFSSVGRTFCDSVQELLPFICISGGEHYLNLFKLYLLWEDKFEKAKALQDKALAEQKLNQSSFIKMKSMGT